MMVSLTLPPTCSCQLLSGSPLCYPRSDGDAEAQRGSVICQSHPAGEQSGGPCRAKVTPGPAPTFSGSLPSASR